MRAGEVIREGGYDGEYGVIRVFQPDELDSTKSVGVLFDLPAAAKPEAPKPRRKAPAEPAVRTEESAPAVSAPSAASPDSPILAGLDPDQRAAAAFVRGPLLIVAGPGTGKTRTLTHRLAHLIADHGAAPEACLAITFTRRAAGEMRERLAHLLPDGRGARVPVMTFHALGLTLLRERQAALGLGAPLRVAGSREAEALAREALGLSAAEARRVLADRTGRPAAYIQALRTRGLVDFDDLVALTVELLTAEPAFAAACRARWPHVSVDEYQDVDERQYRLVRLLAGSAGEADGASLCVIGDPDQAIYGFRGTDVRFFQEFARDYPEARRVQLTRNYRSTRSIVDAALQAVAPGTLVCDRVLSARNADATPLTLRECGTDRAEAEFVVATIERLVGGTSLTSFDTGRAGPETARPYAFGDFAVLYRTAAQTPPLVEALARSGIPFQKRAHGPLAEHPSVQALLTQMKTLPPEAPLTDRLAQAAAVLARAEQPDAELRPIADALRPLAERLGTDLAAFASELALGLDVDLHDPRAERVSLLTLHAAKGLEFRAVFLVGCEDGLLPHRFGFDDQETDLAEERRLFFVGLTRARERLFLSHARRRHGQGELRDRRPSPFLGDIREALLERQREDPPAGPRARQLELF
jgi:DNA helicase-2/ATP-dependent DNA helicase PcrA